jgi:hypothetical protein
MKKLLALALISAAGAAASAGPTISIQQLKDVKWSPMDPKAGDKGPQLAIVFGDAKAKKPTAVYMKFPAGFKPGPHTHTSDYCAVVVQGTLHDWKAPGTDEGPGVTAGGSWCQPGGEAHDNECEASSKDGCVAYVFFPNGFDFKPWTAPAPAKK